jgi:hypothetical protein
MVFRIAEAAKFLYEASACFGLGIAHANLWRIAVCSAKFAVSLDLPP